MDQEPIGAFDPPLDQPPRPRRRGRVLAAAAAVLAVGVVAAVVFWPSEEIAAPASTTRPPTTTTSTTIAAPAAHTARIATVRPEVAEIEVLADEPTGWSDAEPVVLAADRPQPPASQNAAAPREPLPTVEAPIVGRAATATGWAFDNPGPYDPPQPFTMLVEEQRGDWLKVHLPVRPNGTMGWIRADDVELSTTTHRIEVRLGERTLRAYEGAEVIADTQVVVGTPSTPTPTGTFFVTDIVPQRSPSYGPVALATNGYSEVMDEFTTGVPVVALHGTNRPELVGQDRSNGCVRVPNEVIQQLADTVPLGTPVYIFP